MKSKYAHKTHKKPLQIFFIRAKKIYTLCLEIIFLNHRASLSYIMCTRFPTSSVHIQLEEKMRRLNEIESYCTYFKILKCNPSLSRNIVQISSNGYNEFIKETNNSNQNQKMKSKLFNTTHIPYIHNSSSNEIGSCEHIIRNNSKAHKDI